MIAGLERASDFGNADAGMEDGGVWTVWGDFGDSTSVLLSIGAVEVAAGEGFGELSPSSLGLETFFFSLDIYFLKNWPTLLPEPDDLIFPPEEDGEMGPVERGDVETSAVGATVTFIAVKSSEIEFSSGVITLEASNCCCTSDTSASKLSKDMESRTSRVLVSASSVFRYNADVWLE